MSSEQAAQQENDAATRPGPVTVGVGPLTVDDVVAVARGGAGVHLDPQAREGIRESAALIETLANDPVPHYGISTGFGARATTQSRV